MIPEEQIERFFKKQCTAEEALQVAEWLSAHPELVGRYLSEAEWEDLEGDSSLPEATYHEVWQQINNKIRRKRAVAILKRCAVAACVGIGIIAGFLYLNKVSVPAPMVYHKVAVITVAPADTEYNFTTKARRILLRDSSVILLLPKSVVWFDTPFAKWKRTIHLKGEARFDVAKNKQQPFTVYAAAFATTALGTAFVVKQQHNSIKVQLLHGKVVIKVTDTTAIKNWKDVYLSPGQQMIYKEQDKLPRISFIQDEKSNVIVRQATQHNTQSETADSLIFNGSAVSVVLQKLSSYYNVPIQFTESDLKNISFTGVIAKKDAVRNILKVITQMNGLSFEESDQGFIISKIQTNDTHL